MFFYKVSRYCKFFRVMKIDNMKRDAVNAVVNSRFPEMSIEGRRLLEEALVRRKVDKGEIILDKGEVAQSIILVGEGMLRQFYFKNNKDVTEHFSYEGCIVMCIESFMRQEPTRLMVEALENSIVYELSYESLHSLAEASPEFNLLYRKILEYSLIVSQTKADMWRFETAKNRYQHLLETHPEIIKRAPLSHIASYLLMTPETLSRVRAGAL